MDSYTESDSDYEYNEINDDNIREPDKPKKEILIPRSYDEDYLDEELYLKQAIEESLKIAEDKYIALQLEEIKNNEYLQETKKEERKKSLENISFQLVKLKKIDINFNKNLIILEDIIKLYINCEIDNYEITLKIYKNIFDQLKNIRVKENELNLIKNILVITN